MRIRAALLLLLVFACGRRPEAPVPETPTPAEPVNLLDFRRGASVVSPTASFWYESTAQHTIDSDFATAWFSPTGGAEQTIVVVLGARSRIRSLGLTRYGRTPRRLRVDSSLDGSRWTPVTTLPVDPASEVPQIHDVPPFEARYLRVQPIAPNEDFAAIRDLHAYGEEIAPPSPAPIEGCWTLNGRAALFSRRGAAVRGVVEASANRKEMHLDGGFDGRAYRFMWRAGAQVGDAILTVAPDGKTLSGVIRHKGARTEQSGEGWYGTPGPCATTPIDADFVRSRVFEVIRRYPMYGLRFDEKDRLLIDESESALQFIAALKNVRLVARERPARLTSLRDALTARGVSPSDYELVDGTPAMATIKPTFFSPAIEIELKR